MLNTWNKYNSHEHSAEHLNKYNSHEHTAEHLKQIA